MKLASRANGGVFLLGGPGPPWGGGQAVPTAAAAGTDGGDGGDGVGEGAGVGGESSSRIKLLLE